MGLGVELSARDGASPVMIGFGRNMQHSANQTQQSAAMISGSLRNMGLTIAAIGAVGNGFIGVSLAEVTSFSKAIAEVTTLTDEATFATDRMWDVTMGLAATYGGDATQQAKGLYQTISAGVSDAAGATQLMTVANKLAIGGVTDVFTAVDGLTTVVNSYAASNLSAADAADTMFVAIRAGKTNAAELAGFLGHVVPIASQVGVSFQELSAALATATLSGINTRIATTGLKAILENILKPSSDASKEAKRLGIEFNLAALKAKGLPALLREVTGNAKTNDKSFIKLFGSVEALSTVMAITTNGSKKFNEILGQMDGRAGETDKAFQKMASTSAFQDDRFKALGKNALILIGDVLDPMRASAMRLANGVLEAFSRISRSVREPLVKFFAFSSVMLVVVGSGLLVAAAVAGVIAKIAALGVSLSGAAALALPLAAGIATITLALGALGVAYKRDIGGFGTWMRSTVDQAKLAWDGLVQVFAEGGFSGKVREELNRAESQGVKEFVIAVFTWVGRVKNFFSEVGRGFSMFIEQAKPVVEDFTSALTEVGQSLFLVGENDPTKTLGKWERFGAIGRVVGTELGRAAAVALRFGAWMLRAGMAAYEWLKPIGADVLALGADFAMLGKELRDIGVEMGLIDDKVTHSFGIFTMVSGAIRGMFGLIHSAMMPIRALWGAIAFLARGVLNIFGGVIEILSGNVTHGITRIMYGVMSIVVQGVLGVLRVIASLGDALLSKVIPGWTSKADVIGKWQAGADESMRRSFSLPPTGGEAKPTIGAPPPLLAAVNIPSVAAAEAQVQAGGFDAGALASAAEALASVAERPLNVNVPVQLVMPDGEVLASVVAQGQASSAVRNGTPLASF